MSRVNLLQAHGSPTGYLYSHHSCRCVACRAAQAEYNRKYSAEHREETAEYNRKYSAEHTEEIVEYRRKYYAEHAKEINERNRKYSAEHREEQASRSRKYSAAHTEELAEYRRKYNAAHVEARRARLASRRQERDAVRRAWAPNGCLVCGFSDIRAIDAHHRDPREKDRCPSRSASLDELREELAKCDPLCRNHHGILHDMWHNGSKGMSTEAVVAQMMAATL